MKKSMLVLAISAFCGLASAATVDEVVTGKVYHNRSPIAEVCGALLLRTESRCEHQDDYSVVAIAVKIVETADDETITAVNALVPKNDVKKYVGKTVRATIARAGLAKITGVIGDEKI